MFRCDMCNNVTERYEKLNRITNIKRDRTYYHVILSSRNYKTSIRKVYKEKGKQYYSEIEDLKLEGYYISKEYETKGWEIEKELQVCESCKGE